MCGSTCFLNETQASEALVFLEVVFLICECCLYHTPIQAADDRCRKLRRLKVPHLQRTLPGAGLGWPKARVS